MSPGFRRWTLSRHTYAIIVSDVTMPDMNGWQFLRAVRESKVETPVFLMSGNLGPVVMKEALAAGAMGFLPNGLIAMSSSPRSDRAWNYSV